MLTVICTPCHEGRHEQCVKGYPALPGVYGDSKCVCADPAHAHAPAPAPVPQRPEDGLLIARLLQNIVDLARERECLLDITADLRGIAKAAQSLVECILPMDDGNALVSRSYGGHYALVILRQVIFG